MGGWEKQTVTLLRWWLEPKWPEYNSLPPPPNSFTCHTEKSYFFFFHDIKQYHHPPTGKSNFSKVVEPQVDHLDGICTHLCPLTQVWICMHPTNLCSAFIHLFAIPRRTLCTCRRSLHRCSPRTQSCCHRSANRKPSSTQSVERPPTLLG